MIESSLVEYGRRRLLVVAGVMIVALLVTIDATIVNVALPTVEGNIGANFDEGAWIVTGYIIAAVIVIPLTPWLQQLLGRKQYYIAAVAGFTIASVLCGLSTNISELVLFRILQGLCGGGLAATGQAILRDTFPQRELGKSQALFAIGAVGGPAIGPLIGGILTDSLSWNWVFYINVLPGILAIVMLWAFLRNPPHRAMGRFDATGLALLVVGIGCLQYVLGEGERYGWFADAGIATLAAISATGLAGFVAWELFGAKSPIVDLRILRNPAVAAGCGLAMAIGFSLFGSIVLGPQFMQGQLNWTATMTGEAIMVRALAMFIGAPVVLILLNRFRVAPTVLLLLGFALVATGSAMQAFITTTDTTFWVLAPAAVVGGFGFVVQWLPLSVAVLSRVQGLDTPRATSLMSLCNQLGGSSATAIMVTLLDRRSAYHQSNISGDITLHSPAVAIQVQHHDGIATLYKLVLQQSATLAFADAFLFLAAVTIVLMPLIALLRSRGQRAPTEVAVGQRI